jgi:glycosyltransferase involved in cell wall biosynthesis
MVDSGSLLSVVVPAYNEASVLKDFHERLSAVLTALPMRCEILYVNDGSTDETLAVMKSLRGKDARVGIVDLSRNFGKEIAMAAGLDCAVGDALVVIDADLQDPPELIPELVSGWKEGFDQVYAVRISREGESWLKKATAHSFYRLINKLSRIPIPQDTGDFRLLSRRAVESLRKLREQHRFTKGLFTWIGYPQKAIYYHRDPRAAGKTKWNYWRLWNFALEGITSFTTTPLKIATYLGLLTALAAFIYALIIIYKTLAFGEPVRGYPSLMVVILLLGGIQLMGIGVIGEYLGRIFDETKMRPLYFLNDYIPPGDEILVKQIPACRKVPGSD